MSTDVERVDAEFVDSEDPSIRTVCRLSSERTAGYTFEVEAKQGWEETYRLKLEVQTLDPVTGPATYDVVTPWTPYDKPMWMEIHGHLVVCVSAYYLGDEDSGFAMIDPMEAVKVVGNGAVIR